MSSKALRQMYKEHHICIHCGQNDAMPEGVCVNDQSEHVADFVWDERGCKEWEKKDETSADL